MKQVILLLLCCSALCFVTCKKDKMPKAVLPPATQEGKNTIGFTLNDKVWVPYYRCGFFQDPCGEISARYGAFGGAAPNGIGLSFGRRQDSKFAALIIDSRLNTTITSVGNKTDSIGVEYMDNVLSDDGYFIGPQDGSKFQITKIDFRNQIISGEFELILREIKDNGWVTGNFIALKNGRFDFQFNACKKCSN